MNWASTDGFLWRTMNMIAEIIILNILWIIFSLPIFTIGASTTALYYALMIRTRRNEGYVYKNFIKSFKDNFKQSTIIWLILLVAGVILRLDYNIAIAANGTIGKLMLVGTIIILVPYLMILTYIFPVQAKFENKIKDNIKNALLMAVAHFGYTLLILLFFVFFVFMTLRYRFFLGVMLILGMGLYGYITSNIFVAVFRKHLPEELDDDIEASGINNEN